MNRGDYIQEKLYLPRVGSKIKINPFMYDDTDDLVFKRFNGKIGRVIGEDMSYAVVVWDELGLGFEPSARWSWKFLVRA